MNHLKSENGKIYVVNKDQNDEWLLNQNGENSYRDRSWAKSFDNIEDALEYAESTDEEKEIELPDGTVLGLENGEWVEVFT